MAPLPLPCNCRHLCATATALILALGTPVSGYRTLTNALGFLQQRYAGVDSGALTRTGSVEDETLPAFRLHARCAELLNNDTSWERHVYFGPMSHMTRLRGSVSDAEWMRAGFPQDLHTNLESIPNTGVEGIPRVASWNYNVIPWRNISDVYDFYSVKMRGVTGCAPFYLTSELEQLAQLLYLVNGLCFPMRTYPEGDLDWSSIRDKGKFLRQTCGTHLCLVWRVIFAV